MKVVNGVFGVWKVKPERARRDPGARAAPNPPEEGQSPEPSGSPPPGSYSQEGKIRLIVDMRKGNCYFVPRTQWSWCAPLPSHRCISTQMR